MLTERAERLLCLARAFLPPRSESAREAICKHLAVDLYELQQILNGGIEEVGAFEQAITTLDAPDHLLRTYSRLFLAPPAPALPNLGFYLDGAVMGNTCQDIESLYLKYGLERDAHFKDAADHVALYLQFLGWIMARAEEQRLAGDSGGMVETLTDAFQTLTRHATPALEGLQEQIRKAEDEFSLPRVYGQLTRLALAATADDAAALRAQLPARQPAGSLVAETHAPQNSSGPASATPAACTSCGADFVADEGLARMISLLEAKGLDTAHMRICPKCRAADMGMTALKIPTLKKAS
jgi:TorA maturation chaperone TorD